MSSDLSHQSNLPQPIKLYTPPAESPKKRLPTLRRVWRRHLFPELQKKNRSAKTINDIQLHLNRFEEYWRNKRMSYPLIIARLKRENMEEWQQSLLATGLSARTANKHLASIRQLLVCAEKHRMVKQRPRLEQLTHCKASPKLYLTDDQLDRLWNAASQLTWPRVGDLHPAEFWRSALILYRIYGFRTQELIAYELGKTPLQWRNISLDAETPNPSGTAINNLGWLWYLPQKQKWAKPDPLYLPLTRHARAAIMKLADAAGVGSNCSPSEAATPLLPISRAPVTFYANWRSWLKLAKVQPKQLPDSAETTMFDPKHLRKTCATHLDRHHKGLADAVIGWAAREGSRVSSVHYIADELTIVDKLNSAPMPASFDAWL